MKNGWRDIILVYFVHQIIVLGTDYFGQKFLAGRKVFLEPMATIIGGLSHWDGRWFIRVATEGYTVKSAAFFPLYPSLIKMLQNLGIEPHVGALLISNIAFFLILVVFYHLLSRDYDHQVAVRSLWYLSLFPTAFFFSALYSESLYLLFVLLTMYLGRSRRWFSPSSLSVWVVSCITSGWFWAIP
ncbi:MAG: mannosyltransferase family protein [Thermincolia bacterium]